MFRHTTGPGHDLEVFSYERGGFVTLPNVFPLSKQQGMQLLDYQNRHTEVAQTSQMAGFPDTNPLPFERFVGPFHRHVNEPQPLSVNEIMFE